MVEPKAVQRVEDKEEYAKLQVIDANTKCPKCNAKLTKYVHKVLDSVKALDDGGEEILKQFGVTSGESKKKAEDAQSKYKYARAETDAVADKNRKAALERTKGSL